MQQIRGSYTGRTKTNREAPQRMPSRKGIGRAIGVIELSIFNIDIPVFLTDEDRVQELRRRGYDAEPCDRDHFGLVSQCITEDGYMSLAMVITSRARSGTIPHECSHLVDFVFDHVGIPGGVESTEIRAYLSTYLIEQTEIMIAQNQERYPHLYGIEIAEEQAA